MQNSIVFHYGLGTYYRVLFSFRVIVCQLEMIWTCGLNSNEVTKSLKFLRKEIPIIVFGLHMHNQRKQPNLTPF